MSDKFKVIDHVTFERMQQSSSKTAATTAVPKIRNSKYKRMTATSNFNLMQFVKVKQRGKSSELGKKVKIRKRIVDTRVVAPKKKGKQRENGKAKKPSRLKKSILQYRQKKREQAQLEEQITDSMHKLMNLEVNDDSTENEKRTSGLYSRKFRA